jgi:hypothetical protein
MSVGDYWNWLVPKMGTFVGFAKRVPDHHRPHQYTASICPETLETPDGVR